MTAPGPVLTGFTMPSLGADMEDGTLLEWRVAVGDAVRRGDIVALVETRKGAIEIEVYEAGVVAELCVEEGAKVPVGAVLARLAPAAEALPEVPAAAAVAAPMGEEPAEAAARVEPAAPPSPAAAAVAAPAYHPSILPAPAPRAGWIPSSPSARRRAHELGLDLARVPGTGPHGAVLRADVEAAAAAAAPPAPAPAAPAPAVPKSAAPAPAVPKSAALAPPAPAPAVPKSAAPGPTRPAADPMRQAIAAAMTRSCREIPHYHLARELDLGPATAWLSARNAARPITQRLLPAALLIKATALALRRHPALNGWWRTAAGAPGGAFEAASGVHPGVAVSLRGGGLVIPALIDADQQPIDTLMANLTDLVTRARDGRLRSRELQVGTVTITSLGDLGVDLVHGLIYPPQVALIGFGAVAERPFVVDGQLAVRPTVVATLAADHRATDGHQGGRFLDHLARLLATPEEL